MHVCQKVNTLACENIRFSSLFVAEDGFARRNETARNVLSDEERGETDVFAGYKYPN